MEEDMKYKVGDYVKVWVDEEGRKEGLWFEILSFKGEGHFVGKLNNDPVLVKRIKDEDVIEIPLKNIEYKYMDW